MTAVLPNGWSNRRLRFDALLNPVKSEIRLRDDDEVSFVPMDAVGELGGLRLDDIRCVDDVYNGYTYFCDDDVVVAKITPCFENGKGAHASGLHNGVAFGTTELHVIRASPNLDARFLFYVTIAQDFRSFGTAEMLGAGGQKRVPERFLKDWQTPMPALSVQKRIAAFLDEKTARIDGLIARKQALLGRLAEKRQAIITQAVTKGLNPAAPLKDSGIDWLGQIPAHWELKRLKEVCETIVDCKNRTPPQCDDGVFFVVRTSCLGNGDFDESGGYWTDGDAFDEWTKKGTPQPGDVLISREAPIGEACLFPVGYKLCLGQRMMLARPRLDRMAAQFLLWSIYSGLGREYVDLRRKGTTVGHLRVPEVFNFPVIAPPIEEQIEIIERTGKQLEHDEQTKLAITSSITQLTDYRSALITAAVTGQIEGLQ